MRKGEAAKRLGVAPQTFSRYVREGLVVMHDDGGVDLAATRVRVAAFKDRDGGHKKPREPVSRPVALPGEVLGQITQDDASALLRARLDHELEKVAEIRLKNAQRAGGLAPVEEVEGRVIGAASLIRSEITNAVMALDEMLTEAATATQVRSLLTQALDEGFTRAADALERAQTQGEDDDDEDDA